MADLFRIFIWIIIIGLLIGGIQISENPEKTDAPFKIGDEVTMKITYDDSVNGIITNYFILKIRFSDEEKWRIEKYTIQYKDINGKLESIKCSPNLLKEYEEEIELYKYE